MDTNGKGKNTDKRMDQMRKDIELYMRTMGEREIIILYKISKNLHQDIGR